jgi:electron transfer flavoprotein beta subunit
MTPAPLDIAVCWKWVSIGDPGGASSSDTRWAGVSAADEAALETALSLVDAAAGTVTVVCLGPPAADTALRAAIATGASHAVRIDGSTALDSHHVATELAAVVSGSDIVVCGDYSLDRGSGSVPAFLAHELGAAQALGLLQVTASPSGDATLRCLRRLDGGRREVLDVHSPAVISVEGSVARLRRAALGAVVGSKTAPITEVKATVDEHAAAAVVFPYRPRARVLAPPHGGVLDRVRDILDVGGSTTSHGDPVVLEPADAARRILDQLDAWGCLHEPSDTAS